MDCHESSQPTDGKEVSSEGKGSVQGTGEKRPPDAEPPLKNAVSLSMVPDEGSLIMLRFVQGDDDAFEELLTMYEEGALNYFYRLTGKRHAAEDLTQELFIRVFRYRDRYTRQATFKSFLFRMARNLWIDRYRKLKVRPLQVSLSGKSPSRSRDGDESDMPVISPEATPHEAAVRDERIRRLGGAVQELPDKLREVVVLCLEGRLKYAEMSEILDVPVGTIKSRMHTAVQRLRELMEES